MWAGALHAVTPATLCSPKHMGLISRMPVPWTEHVSLPELAAAKPPSNKHRHPQPLPSKQTGCPFCRLENRLRKSMLTQAPSPGFLLPFAVCRYSGHGCLLLLPHGPETSPSPPHRPWATDDQLSLGSPMQHSIWTCLCQAALLLAPHSPAKSACQISKSGAGPWEPGSS